MNELLQTVIFLVRHGETDFAYVGDKDIDARRVLTEKGHHQCHKNGEYLADFAPVAIYASPLKRTIQSAEEIKRGAKVSCKIVPENDLYEIYDNASWESIKTRLPALFEKIIEAHAGSHVICVSHLDVIEGVLKALGATDKERDSSCQMGEMYRLVFAGKRFVQATKLTPAKY